jgi:hypothetical protein
MALLKEMKERMESGAGTRERREIRGSPVERIVR